MVSEEISHYRILRKLGAGGMGEVYLAEDLVLSRKVAIKMLPSRSLGNEQAKKRLFREAKAAATLDHPNICAIHEVGEDGDSSFIVMQYIKGDTLSNTIKNNPLPPSEIIDIGIQATAALAEAHSHGIIHRDIKPQNVIITPRGQVKVLDFGLAKILQDEQSMQTASSAESRLTDTGEIVGTVGYMSPEQLKDLPIDARSDLFSLGVTLYECATGKNAFSGSSKIQISLQVIQFDPPRPSQVNPEIPFGLDEIILKAIAKEPDVRYQSADEMLLDLKDLHAELQEGSASKTRQFTTPEPGSSRRTFAASLSGTVRKTPARVKIGILIALLAAGVLTARSFWRPSSYQPSPEAKSWYDRGIADMRAGTYYQASKELEQSIQIDGEFAMAHARLAETYLEIDNTDKAMEELLLAISLVPDKSALASRDALYLEAVGATVRRDFPKAIEFYRQLADKIPELEKASAYVDLGRACEKDQQIDKAQDYYLEATKKDSQSAAAFLRLATLYGRRQDPKSEEAFNKAEEYYGKMSNLEGVAETFYQRGALLAKFKRFAEARALLNEALKTAQNLPDNKYQFVKTKLQLSGVYHNQGDAEAAKNTATEAIEVAQKYKIQNLVTNGVIDLGYMYLNLGQFGEAGKLFKQALEFAVRDKAPSSEARAKRMLGSLNQQQGKSDEAIPLLEQALQFYEQAGYRKEATGALLLLGRAHRDKGDYDGAVKIFDQTLELAKDDPARRADAHLSIAILRGEIQERYPDALSHLEECYKTNDLLGAKKDMAYNQMNRGAFLWQLGRYQEARSALSLSYDIANKGSYKQVLAWVHLVNSQMALSERRFDEAKRTGQLALDVASEPGNEIKDVIIRGKCAIGLAQAFSGSPQPGRRLCEEAVKLAREVKIPQLLSSSLSALGEVALIGNDARAALAAALEAQAMFAKADQQDSGWRALLIAARASRLAGNVSEAQQYALRAENLCKRLPDKWGADQYDSYLTRPDILVYRSQIGEFLTGSR